MDFQFQKCLEENKLVIVQDSEASAVRELEAAKSDLHSAKMALGIGDYKWSIIQAHCAMWHAGRSLLYFEGYEDKNPYSLIVALESLFGGKGKLSRASLGYLKESQRLREKAEHDLQYSPASAEHILSAAEQFIGETETILGS